MDKIKELTDRIIAFRDARDWKKFHNPKDVAISLSLEVGEVLEHFQWKDTPTNPAELEGELADVDLYLLQLATLTGIDLEQAVLNKLEHNYHRTWDQS